MSVMTVTGQINAEDMGVTTAHEHIFINLTAFFTRREIQYVEDPETAVVRMDRLGILNRDPYALRDNLLYEDFDVQKQELIYFKNAGGKTVVDATSLGIDRDPKRLYRMALETGLNILMGTGYYVGATHPQGIMEWPVKKIAREMVQELTIGVGDTGIRAGFIGEIGISERFQPSEAHVLRAAGLASLETGAAIHVHINPWTVNGLKACEILLETGVKADRICIDHVDVQGDLAYIHQLLDWGVFVEFDNFGKEYFVNYEARNEGYGNFIRDTQRVSIIHQLLNQGFAGQILLSNDVCLKNLLHAYGGWGYDHLLTNIVPMMREEGILSSEIEQILIANPARFFDIP